MKRTLSFVFALVILLTSTMLLTSCDNVFEGIFGKASYTAAAEFYYSSDAGATYGNRTKEFTVNETVYMQIIAKVTSTSKKEEQVTMTLTIPNVDSVAAAYYDGQIITPRKDEVNNVTYYEFTIIAGKNSTEQNFVFQFKPNQVSSITMKLEFDDKVDSVYDKQNTVTFVESNSQGE